MEVIMYDLNVLIFDINKTAEDEEQVKTLNNLLSLFGGKAEIKNKFDRNQYYPTMKKSSKNGKQEMQAAQAITIIFPLKKSGK